MDTDKQQKANKAKTQEVQAAEKKAAELEKRLKDVEAKSQETETLLKQKETEKEGIQGELDDLLMVFADREDKVTRYQVSAFVFP